MKICSNITKIYKETLDVWASYYFSYNQMKISDPPLVWIDLCWKKKHIRANSDDQIILSRVDFLADYSVLSLKGNEMSLLYCLSNCLPLYIKQLHSLSSCPSIRYFFWVFFICFILNVSFVILLFEVYLCNKFINRLQMAGYTILIL